MALEVPAPGRPWMPVSGAKATVAAGSGPRAVVDASFGR